MAYVLVVDDEGDSRAFVARYLHRIGHRVGEACDGREALHALTTGRPDLVLLDVRMPGLDGVGLLEVMRSYLRWHALPVVILSAHANSAELERARQLGVRHVFRKAAFSLDDLAIAIDEALESGPPQ
jgi:CheY-like chemotaxis protein